MLTSKIESYKNVLKPYLYLMPDAEYEPLTSEQYDQIAASLPDEIEKNYQLYLESLETPMPFYIGVPTIDGDKLKFNWDVSYDLDAEDITYSVEVARDYLFRDVIYQNTTLIVPEADAGGDDGCRPENRTYSRRCGRPRRKDREFGAQPRNAVQASARIVHQADRDLRSRDGARPHHAVYAGQRRGGHQADRHELVPEKLRRRQLRCHHHPRGAAAPTHHRLGADP